MNDRNEIWHPIVLVLALGICSVTLSFGFGSVIGAGLAYFGLNVNPYTVGFLFMCLTGIGYSFLVLNGSRR